MTRRLLGCFALFSSSLLGQDAALEHARQVNLERAANMPNFVADEIIKRYTARGRSSEWKYQDTIESEVMVKGIQISRQNFRRNGKPWNPETVFGVPMGLPGTGFGAVLKPLFDPECTTRLASAGREDLRGKPALVYSFRSPADGCFGNLYGNYPYNAARSGRVLIDESTGELLRFEEEATGFPRGFLFTKRTQVMIWDSVKVEDAFHWLPVGADLIWQFSNRQPYRTTIEYRNHRHFEAASKLTF